jgi:hypothetical protein
MHNRFHMDPMAARLLAQQQSPAPLGTGFSLPNQDALRQAMANIQTAQQAPGQGNVTSLGRFGATDAERRRRGY